MIGYSEGKCRLCGESNTALNEGICGKHSSDAAQGYLFGFADGLATRPATPDEQTMGKVRGLLGSVLDSHNFGYSKISGAAMDKFTEALALLEPKPSGTV